MALLQKIRIRQLSVMGLRYSSLQHQIQVIHLHRGAVMLQEQQMQQQLS